MREETPATWTPPTRCSERPFRGTLEAETAALGPLPVIAWPEVPPVGKRGKKAPTRTLPMVSVPMRPRPHKGMYTGVPPAIDTSLDRECAYALVLPALGPDDRQKLMEILLTPPPTDQGAAPDPRVAFAERLAQRSEPAAWFTAALLLSPGASPAVLSQARQLLERTIQSVPGSDPLGGRARLRLAELDEDGAHQDQEKLLQFPLIWATRDALLGLAADNYERGSSTRAFALFNLVAGSKPGDRIESEARVWAARVAIEDGRPDLAFAQMTILFREPRLAGALVPGQLNSLSATASRAITSLPLAALGVLATWPPFFAAQVAEDVACSDCDQVRLRQLEAITVRGGGTWSARDHKLVVPTDVTLQRFLSDCASDLSIWEGSFALTVEVFGAGLPVE